MKDTTLLRTDTVELLAFVGGLDYVVLPALVAFLGITFYALWRRQRTL